MSLKATYDTLEGVEEHFHPLFTERDGKFELTGIEGVKTEADVSRVTDALNKERTDHKATKGKFAPWAEMDHEQNVKDIAELEEARVKITSLEESGGKIDEDKLAEMADKRAATRSAPLERRITELETTLGERDISIIKFENHERVRTIHDAVREAMVTEKVVEPAHDDILMLAERMFEVRDDGKVIVRDDVGILPGADPKQWLVDMRERRPHWWPPSQGAGATGGTGTPVSGNPWGRDTWDMTKQGAYVKEHGSEKAMNLVKQAGLSRLGERHPPKLVQLQTR